MIGHPSCIYLTVTANKWLKDQPERKSGALVGAARRRAQKEAIDFFIKLASVDIPKICIENPVGIISSVWRKPDQIIQPFQFGHKEPKKTCLWLKGLPLLKATSIVEPEYHITKSGKTMPKWYAYADKSKGQAERSKIRSKTFPGIANAMAEQWGNLKFIHSTANNFMNFETQQKLEAIRSSKEELKKCLESPLYFYNTYVKHPDKPELTQEEYDRAVISWEKMRHRRINIPRKFQSNPLTLEQVFQSLPPYLKPE